MGMLFCVSFWGGVVGWLIGCWDKLRCWDGVNKFLGLEWVCGWGDKINFGISYKVFGLMFRRLFEGYFKMI